MIVEELSKEHKKIKELSENTDPTGLEILLGFLFFLTGGQEDESSSKKENDS